MRSVNYTRRQVLDFSSPRGARPIFHVHAFPPSLSLSLLLVPKFFPILLPPPPSRPPTLSNSLPSSRPFRQRGPSSYKRRRKEESSETKLHRLNPLIPSLIYDKFDLPSYPSVLTLVLSFPIGIRRYDIYDVANGHPFPVSFFRPPRTTLLSPEPSPSLSFLLALEFPFDHPRLHLFPSPFIAPIFPASTRTLSLSSIDGFSLVSPPVPSTPDIVFLFFFERKKPP